MWLILFSLTYHLADISGLKCPSEPLTGKNGLYLANTNLASEVVFCGDTPNENNCPKFLETDSYGSTITITGNYHVFGMVRTVFCGACDVTISGNFSISCCGSLQTTNNVNVDSTSELLIGENSSVGVESMQVSGMAKVIVGSNSQLETVPNRYALNVNVADQSVFEIDAQTTVGVDGSIWLSNKSQLSVSGSGLTATSGLSMSIRWSRVRLNPSHKLFAELHDRVEITIVDSTVDLLDSFFNLRQSFDVTASSVLWQSNSTVFLPLSSTLVNATFTASNATFQMQEGTFEMKSGSKLLLNNVYVGLKLAHPELGLQMGFNSELSLQGNSLGETMYCYTISDNIGVVIPDNTRYTQNDNITNLSCSTESLSTMHRINIEDPFATASDYSVVKGNTKVIHQENCEYLPATDTPTSGTKSTQTTPTYTTFRTTSKSLPTDSSTSAPGTFHPRTAEPNSTSIDGGAITAGVIFVILAVAELWYVCMRS